mmetsp:Transcript_12134/g.34132  ORF Transcript_12134/g.34132 Transcript_12134/m.34132 type:complete len:113 (+) Transcript_12134:197-535(+)
MEDLPQAHDALLAAAAELVAAKAVYHPGASAETQQGKLEKAWHGFVDSCDKASLQLDLAKAYVLRQQAKEAEAALATSAAPASDKETIQKLEAQTVLLYNELQTKATPQLQP